MKKEKEERDNPTEEKTDDDSQEFKGELEETPFNEAMRIVEQRGSIRGIKIF